MNKSQKEYTAARIRQILNERLIRCTCKEPDLGEHMQKAAVDGELELLPSRKIKENAKHVVIRSSSSRYLDVHFSGLFKEPKSYVAAKTAHLLEEEQIREANEKREAIAQAIIDRVFLDEFEKGEDAISEMMSAFTS